mmetsp:Transcript_12748/g.23899  ORF Transcript_12748/g.23899 Transcript_12748/m.23899 type:complete len:204 (-) Transcript_12748:524-1135(-)
MVVISNSDSGISISSTSSSSNTGITSTPAKVVCLLLFALKGLNLTNRCAPFSPRNQPYALVPSIRISTDLYPTTSPAVFSCITALYSILSACRRYILCNISTQSHASVPPAPAVRINLAGLSSNCPFNKDSNSYFLPSSKSFFAATLHSSTIISIISSSSASFPEVEVCFFISSTSSRAVAHSSDSLSHILSLSKSLFLLFSS